MTLYGMVHLWLIGSQCATTSVSFNSSKDMCSKYDIQVQAQIDNQSVISVVK